MIPASVDINRCKACGLCVSVCPKKVISIDTALITRSGMGSAVISEGCIGCGSCYIVCPDIAITIRKEVNS